MKKLINFVLILIILAACTKKQENILNYEVKNINSIENIINDNTPSVPVEELNINLKKVLEINGIDSVNILFTQPKYFTDDGKGNIFIFDESDYNIHKFDSKGNYLLEFGGEGTGPGEFQYCMGMCCLEDTLFVIDTPVKKMNRFSLEGKFINSSIMPAFTSLYNRIFTAQRFLWIQRMSFKRFEDKVEMHKIVEARESSLHRVSILDSSSIDWPPKDIKGELSVSKDIATNDSSIFLADKGDLYNYEIKEYGLNFKLNRVIKKKFSRMKVTDKEKDIALAEFTKTNPDFNPERYLKDHDYKPAIRWIFTDKYNRLWVEESRPLDSYDDKRTKFSIFKDGIYQNSILLDIGINNNWFTYDVMSYGKVQFINDKIYVLDKDENRLYVFEY
jgi:hypothetical protein